MSGPDRRVEYRGTGFYLGLVAIILFAVALLVLAVQNTQEVDVEFFGFVFNVPLFAVAIGAALLAVILDELIGLVWRRQRRNRLEERAELVRLRASGPAEVEEQIEEEPKPADVDLEQSGEAPSPAIGDHEAEPAEGRGEETPPH